MLIILLYADDLCIISLSSAGLQQLLVQYDWPILSISIPEIFFSGGGSQ